MNSLDPVSAWCSPYASTPYDVWTRTNVGEVFPRAVTPLTYAVMTELADLIFTRDPVRLASIPKGLFRDGLPPTAIRAINARMFFNNGLVHHIFTEVYGLPSWFWSLSLGGPQDQGSATFAPSPLRPTRLLRHLPALLREAARQRAVVDAFWRDEASDLARGYQLQREDLSALSARELLVRLGRVMTAAVPLERQLFDGSSAALSAYGLLAGLCKRWCSDRALANDLVTGLATLRTADATISLWRVARVIGGIPAAREALVESTGTAVVERWRSSPECAPVVAAFDAFLRDFGHRCVDEFELSVPRWREDPTLVLSTLRTYVVTPPETDPETGLRRQAERRRRAEKVARRRMSARRVQRVVPWRWLAFRAVLRQTRLLLPLRENPKHIFLMFAADMRRTILAIAGRLVAGGVLPQAEEIFYLTREEVAVAVDSLERGTPLPGMADLIAARRSLYERFAAWQVPDVIVAADVERVEREVLAGTAEVRPSAVVAERPAGGAGEMRGIAASRGVVTGRARVALTPDEGADIEPGEILVAPFTDPGWTPLFAVAGAIVMDLGGLLSHGAIVAREYGIPAVVNVRGATRTIRTGQMVTVDGGTGIVRVEG